MMVIETREALIEHREDGRDAIRCATRSCGKLLGLQSPSVRVEGGDIEIKCPRCGGFFRIPNGGARREVQTA